MSAPRARELAPARREIVLQAEPRAGQRHPPPEQHQQHQVREDGREQRHLCVVSQGSISAMGTAPRVWLGREGARLRDAARNKLVVDFKDDNFMMTKFVYLAPSQQVKYEEPSEEDKAKSVAYDKDVIQTRMECLEKINQSLQSIEV